MRTIFVLFAAPAIVGALVGYLVRRLFRRKDLSHAWLLFAAALCFAAMDTGAVWYARTNPSEGWADLAALITGTMLLTFSLAGLLVNVLGQPKGSLSLPWPPPASPLRAALLAFWGYGLGTLLLSAVVFLLGVTVGFSPMAGEPGLPFPAYALLLVLAYPLLGLFLCRWLSCEKASLPAALSGLSLWLAILVGLGLLLLGREGSLWGQLYGRVNFPAAVCLGDYRYVLPDLTLKLVIAMSCPPPILFGVGWLLGRRARRE